MKVSGQILSRVKNYLLCFCGTKVLKLTSKMKRTEFSVPLTDSGKGWENASKDFRFASSVAGFGMLVEKFQVWWSG